MEFRKGIEGDIPGIMNIIRQAQTYLEECGVDQWQNGYPDIETIRNDIRLGYSYVMVEGDHVLGTVALIFDGEKTYDTIYEGKWLSSGSYAAIHRIAVAARYKGSGLAGDMMKNIENICLNKGVDSIKIDTHEDNKTMQRYLDKNGFKYCGVIYLEDGNKRLAFEKLL